MMGEQPFVLVAVDASVDGKIALTADQVLLDPPSDTVWSAALHAGAPDVVADLEARVGSVAIVQGSGTFVTAGAGPLDLPTPADGAPADYLPAEVVDRAAPPHRWFVAVDRRGRIRWRFTGDGTTDLLVVVAPDTPAGYRRYLHDEHIPYLTAPSLPATVARLAALGVRGIVVSAGGGFGAAMLRAGLVREVQVTVHPFLVGGLGTPSVMDGPASAIGAVPTSLTLLSADRHDQVVTLRYGVG